uniref:ATP-grasp domain-containing protein n=1 Tax=Ficedula albicollis TaxID=59894 RepID=U3KCI6_FICAL
PPPPPPPPPPPRWLEDEAPDGEVPGDSGDPDSATHAYERLQSALCQEGLPPTLDCSAEPRTGWGHGGGGTVPGAMVLCLSPTWASRVPSEATPGAWSLLLSRGVSFKVGGHSALETFVPPRRANYVTGTFAPGDPEGGWVGELARDLDCPTGGSVPLAHRLEDTLVARWVLAARANLPVPPTLAFVLGARGDLPAEPVAPGVRLVRLEDPQGQQSLVQEEVGAFLGGTAIRVGLGMTVAVLFPSLPGAGLSRGHHGATGSPKSPQRSERSGRAAPSPCGGRACPVPCPPGSPAPRLPMALRICTLVCRSWGDRPQLCQVQHVPTPWWFCVSPAYDGCPCPMSCQRQALATRLREATEAAMAALLATEAELSPQQRGGTRAHTDILGVDFLLACVDDALELVALATNSQRCLETCVLAEAMGRHAAPPPPAEAMLHRAQCHLVEGKDILLIGAGGVSKSFVWEAARDYGLRIHLVESDPEHFAAGLVQTFLPYDSREHRRDEEHAERVLELLRSRGLRPHNAGQCHAHAARLWRDLRDDADHPGIGLGWGNAMLLMEYVPGTEHDVDLVVFEGRLLGAWVSDNGPTRVPAFLETAACLPSCLPADRQAQLVRAALECCRACGLRDGVFNVELKLGPAGPRLLEINPRMGGFYLRDWIREVYGPDLLLAAVLVALGALALAPQPLLSTPFPASQHSPLFPLSLPVLPPCPYVLCPQCPLSLKMGFPCLGHTGGHWPLLSPCHPQGGGSQDPPRGTRGLPMRAAGEASGVLAPAGMGRPYNNKPL